MNDFQQLYNLFNNSEQDFDEVHAFYSIGVSCHREEECEEVFKHMALGVALGTIPLVIIVSSGIILQNHILSKIDSRWIIFAYIPALVLGGIGTIAYITIYVNDCQDQYPEYVNRKAQEAQKSQKAQEDQEAQWSYFSFGFYFK